VSRSDWIALGGVIANFVLAVVAVAVPIWQRRAMLSDARRAEKRSWNRFIEAFNELAAAQDALVAASMSGNSTAFAAVEPKMQSALEAFAISSASPLPVKAAINASRAHQIATEALAGLPALKLYGSSLMSYETIKANLKKGCEATHALLREAEQLAGQI